MKLAHIAVALGALTGLSVGCDSAARPLEPPLPPPGPESPLTRPGFPALSRAGDIYTDSDSLYHLYSRYQIHGALTSRIVLYADGMFALQFSSLQWGFFEYPGQYVRSDGVITFDFHASTTAGPWAATGALSGDSLRILYNTVMASADFLDGVYVRAGVTP